MTQSEKNTNTLGETHAGFIYGKLKFGPQRVQREIDNDDHLDRHDTSIIKRLWEYQAAFPKDFAGYPPEIQLATVMAFVHLDDQIGLENIADRLDIAIQHTIFSHGTQRISKDPTTLMDEVDTLQQIAKQFRWIASHGCRRF